MTRTAADSKALQVQARVHEATLAARDALAHFDPPIRALAVRQLSVEVEIFAVALSMLMDRPPAPIHTIASSDGPWTPDQVAEKLHVTRSAVDKWLGSGALRKTKAGKRVLILEEDLQDFLKRSTEHSDAA